MSLAELSLRYAAFAVLATLVNLLTQEVSLRLYEGVLALYLAMAAGTLTGLVTKYLLDKRWIFGDRSAGWEYHSRKFTLYSLMGIATTLIFWVSELTFEAIFQSDIMRNFGAVIGLAIGYTIKYRLDRRFVFARDGARDGAREGAA